MHLIVGLGNPGKKYQNNRHNIGAMALEAIARQHGFPPFKQKFKGLFCDGTIEGNRVGLLFPQTYMNKSGDSVRAAVQFYKLSPSDVSVIYDELDLNPGKVRIKTGGGHGGHNGLRSIDPQIGKDYQRVRLGIGHPGSKERVTSHVLGDFHKIDHEWLDALLEAVGQNAAMLVNKNASGFMNKMALAVQKADEQVLAAQKQKPAKKTAKSLEQNKNSQQGQLASMLKKLFNKD